MTKVIAVVVTYNRKILLLNCIDALLHQSLNFDKIIIVDNASTDGTIEFLEAKKILDHPKLVLLKQNENTGGAGGFSAGMKYAFESGADYVWMMDDDAVPHQNALEQLMNHATPNHIYGSLAVNGEDTAWTTTLLPDSKIVNSKDLVPEISEVQSLPFLGYLTSKEIFEKLGLPDNSYFIAADDVEYCLRAQRAGFKTYVCGQSYIEHPKSDRYPFNLFGKKLICLKLVPWKRYYDTRNRLLIARKYYGVKAFTQTLPASFVRLFAALINEPNRVMQIKAFFAGVYDALLKNTGRRHDYWKL
ncbi:glycosyltransferase family 2 protein [Acinetobacter faecalis]|uniref:glycosyltransferase family 2 protein n=1 Tax=Acinetobacter faecalis TaxID=2665161 RepID=UPI002A91A6C7|nr:glycosyltransferase family 2 protein [Acinetobacter faecalis]MDY6467993.1 glycosyltransferase family 2 protein [Acinetobacter faecalis]